MGDMADYTLELAESEMDGLYFDNVMYEEESDSYYGPGRRKDPVCKFCGKPDLKWRKRENRWILHESNSNIHDCPKHPLPLRVLKEIAANKNMNTDIDGITFKDYVPPTWDVLFMKMVFLVAEKSRDPSTKIGAVLVKDKRVISTGYNGFPAGVMDLPERYNDRTTKLKFVVHAEDNAILTASRFGISTVGAVLYTNGIPCCECTKSVIQGGISEIVIHGQWPDMTHSAWVESVKVSKIMLEEAGIPIRVLGHILNVNGYLDGKIIKV